MTRRWLAGLSLVLACASTSEPGSTAAEPPLEDTAFARPWVLVDRLAPELPFDTVVRAPGGFVAVTHAPTNDGKANPPRSNLAAFSVDGLTWERHSLGDTVHTRALAAGNGVIVGVGMRFGSGTRGSVVTSPDGRTWAEHPAPDVGLMALRFVQGQFWAFGDQGGFFTSRDGKTWADQSRPASGQLNDIAYGKGRYVVVGNGSWLSSTDGRTWIEQRAICNDLSRWPGVTPPGGQPTGFPALFSVVFGNGTFVTAGAVGPWASSDGLTWTEAPSAIGGSVFTRGRFIARVDGRLAVAVSEDGRSWLDRTGFIPSDRNQLSCADHTCITLDDAILVVPRLDDVLPAPRRPPLELDRSSTGQTVTVSPGQRISIFLQTVGPGEFGEPQLSSPAVRLVTFGYSGGPPTPAGPSQIYDLVAESPGRAELHIPHTGMDAPFQLVIDVSAP
jgi:hypothetical protein